MNTEEIIFELEDLPIEISKTKKQRGKISERNGTEYFFQELWHNYKMCYIYVLRIPEGEKSDKRTYYIL